MAPTIPADVLVEEEALPHYKSQHYYPAQIGDEYLSRYEVVAKLGYGSYSTVWLCRDNKK